MLSLHGISYAHPNKQPLFTDISLTIGRRDRTALVGNNGAGKSTLLKLMAGQLHPSAGSIRSIFRPYYVPQLTSEFDDRTIADVLHVAGKIKALRAITEGRLTDAGLALLDDDWAIEERCKEALARWGFGHPDLDQPFGSLSGGEKTKVFLSGILIHQPEIVLLDEPSNHLDLPGRQILYDYIRTSTVPLVVVSHDRTLLGLLNTVLEVSPHGITTYGGDYTFYVTQKMIDNEALANDLRNKEKELHKAKATERDAIQRQQKLDARGKAKQEKAGLPTISMKTFKNNAEKSTARTKDIHAEKVASISQQLDQLRSELPDADKMRMKIEDSMLHKGKILISAKKINHRFGDRRLWQHPLDIQLISGERLVVKGPNGSGKTTLIQFLLGELTPDEGHIEKAPIRYIYIDQDYSLLDNDRTVYQQAQEYTSGDLQEHEIKTRLTHFLFTKDAWDKPCRVLSGGERMRLMLCLLTMNEHSPDIIVLDEPTNNLDIRNIDILIAAVNAYRGTLLVISHDEDFLSRLNITNSLSLIPPSGNHG